MVLSTKYAITLLCLVQLACLTWANDSDAMPRRAKPWFAARCVFLSTGCTRYFTRYNACLPGISFDAQPDECYSFVCDYCTTEERRTKKTCGSTNVVNACAAYSERKAGPDSTNTDDDDTVTSGDGDSCVWTGEGDNVVIDLGKVTPGEGWDRTTRDGYSGIIFARSPARGISPKGEYGRMCFDVKAPKTGKYYLAAVSYAPHVTEHNDAWVTTSKGFELWQSGNKRMNTKPYEWLKAYQNNGQKGISEHFKTIDHDGHRFLIPDVVEGEMFQVCLAGRSKNYEMFRLVLKLCEGDYCQGKILKGDLVFGLEPSKCLM